MLEDLLLEERQVLRAGLDRKIGAEPPLAQDDLQRLEVADVRGDHARARSPGEEGRDGKCRELGVTVPPRRDRTPVLASRVAQGALGLGCERLILAVDEADGAAPGGAVEELP